MPSLIPQLRHKNICVFPTWLPMIGSKYRYAFRCVTVPQTPPPNAMGNAGCYQAKKGKRKYLICFFCFFFTFCRHFNLAVASTVTSFIKHGRHLAAFFDTVIESLSFFLVCSGKALSVFGLSADTRMAIKANEFIPGSSPDEMLEILQPVASEFGDEINDMNAVQKIQLSGAMTNMVFLITWPTKNGDPHRRVLVRFYGEGVEVFFNRDDEIRIFECMSKHGKGPRLLGRFDHGRVEEFIYGRTLSAADLRDPEISALIAARMREFHYLDMPCPKEVLLWDRIRSWLSKAKILCSPKDAKDFQLEALEEEIIMLEKELPRDDQEIGFCHNDLQYGNIMMDEERREITIIDYEYASYNPVAYDIANHFCEMAANYHSDMPHILDYSRYPGLEERQRFVYTYLASAAGGDELSEAEVEQLLEDVEKYTLANHLFWGLWGIISGYVNKIDFEYKEYARQRFQQYWLRKPSLLGS